jgi:hypothetical protein
VNFTLGHEGLINTVETCRYNKRKRGLFTNNTVFDDPECLFFNVGSTMGCDVKKSYIRFEKKIS